jgi:alpha-mannosidase
MSITFRSRWYTRGNEVSLEQAMMLVMGHDDGDGGQLEALRQELRQTQEMVAKLARIVVEGGGVQDAIDALLPESDWQRVFYP